MLKLIIHSSDISNFNYYFFFAVKPDSVDVLAPILAKYKAAQDGGKILYVHFTSVNDYFWLLRAACECLSTVGPRALLYLAAAVSDFYVPSNQLVSYLFLCRKVSKWSEDT